MANPLDLVIKFIFDNIFIILILGFLGYFAYMYLNVSRKPKFKVIDREEVERQKFVEAMRLNTSPKNKKYLYKGDLSYIFVNGGNGTIKQQEKWENYEKLGLIKSYMEFEQTPIKMTEKEGKITYVELKDKKTGKPIQSMKLIGLVIQPTLFWKIKNPLKKPYPVIIENDESIVTQDGNKLIVPSQYGFDRFMGYYYAVNQDTKPKLRNILDARILVTDFNLMASRYFAKSQEQCVYSPEVASQLAQREKELQIQLAKTRGTQKSI